MIRYLNYFTSSDPHHDISKQFVDRMPEDLPVRKCINVMVGIIRKLTCKLDKTSVTSSDRCSCNALIFPQTSSVKTD